MDDNELHEVIGELMKLYDAARAELDTVREIQRTDRESMALVSDMVMSLKARVEALEASAGGGD